MTIASRMLVNSLAIAAVTCGWNVSEARADHDVVRAVYRTFELRRAELERCLSSDRNALNDDYTYARNRLSAEYDRILHSHRPDRGLRLREVRRRMDCAARDYGAAIRDLNEDYALRRKVLNHERDLALAEARYEASLLAAAPLPARRVAEFGYGDRGRNPRETYADRPVSNYDSRGYSRTAADNGAHVVFRRSASPDVDWTGVILSVLANRANR